MRHLRVKQLWLQEEIRNQTITATKVGTLDNLADLSTKHLGGKEFRRQTLRLGLRPEAAVQMLHRADPIQSQAICFRTISALACLSDTFEFSDDETEESEDWEDDGIVTVSTASSMSSEELEAWRAALAPCIVCTSRTPFRCGACQAVVCLEPRCRDIHRPVCGLTWQKCFWSCISKFVWRCC